MQICCFDQGENFYFAHNVFCIPQETDWQKARYEGNSVNDRQWLELIQEEIYNETNNETRIETQNSHWKEQVMERLCKFVGVTR